ncbi:hypothetical protein [Streptomyces cyaneofuscatus]|uniref:hypothetical protein n=1 Tax=Streptomyces cyaneofuscatus TaxID=66883 RepID=UPI00379BEC09
MTRTCPWGLGHALQSPLGRPRQIGVKGGHVFVWTSSRWLNTGLRSRFARIGQTADSIPHVNQELAMADLAFVVTTIAVFALVALIARGVTKL